MRVKLKPDPEILWKGGGINEYGVRIKEEEEEGIHG